MINHNKILEAVEYVVSTFKNGDKPSPFSYACVVGVVGNPRKDGIKVLYNTGIRDVEVFTLYATDEGRLKQASGQLMDEMSLINCTDNPNLLIPAIKTALDKVIYNHDLIHLLIDLINNATRDLPEDHTTEIDFRKFAGSPRLKVYGADAMNPFLVFSLPTNNELYEVEVNGTTNISKFVSLEYMFGDICYICRVEAEIRAMVKDYITPEYFKQAMSRINIHEMVVVVDNKIFAVDGLRNDLNLRNRFLDVVSVAALCEYE